MREETPIDDYDGAWKETLEKYFRPFLELCFPAVAKEINWAFALEFMDKELEATVRDAELGKRRVDKLAKVTAMDGSLHIVFLHIEIQEQTEENIGKRMFEYNNRLASRFNLPIVSLLFLTGRGWKKRTGAYKSSLWGCKVHFDYPVCRLRDFGDFETLANLNNPVGVVMAAHWASQRTKKNENKRFEAKMWLVLGLYKKCGEKSDFLELFRLVDWLLRLSDEKELAFRHDVEEYEQKASKTMAYITSIERIGMAQGEVRAKQAYILDALEVRFERVPEGLKEVVEGIQEIPKLQELHRHAILCESIEHFTEKL